MLTRTLVSYTSHIRFERASVHIRIVEGLRFDPLTTARTNLKEKEEMSRE